MIPISRPEITAAEKTLANEAVESTWISSKGDYLEKFEAQFARMNNANYCTSSSNGTTALHLALESLQLKPGSEIIVPSFTFVATVNAVLYCRFKPVFVDVDPNTWCMCPEAVSAAVTSNTTAIIPVHLYGIPCDMPKIMAIARENNLMVIEDAAEAHFAKIGGKNVGTLGDLGVFSFFGNKIFTTGEGGAILSNSLDLIQRIDLLKNHGMNPMKRYDHPVMGYNYRLNNISAAIGVAQLERAEYILLKRREIFEEYDRGLEDISDILTQPRPLEGSTPSPWMYTFALKNKLAGSRDELIEHLYKHGIEGRPGFLPVHKMSYINSDIKLPNTEDLSKRTLSLPTFNELSAKDIAYICDIIKIFAKNKI